jgi:hypothetical protein
VTQTPATTSEDEKVRTRYKAHRVQRELDAALARLGVAVMRIAELESDLALARRNRSASKKDQATAGHSHQRGRC